MSLHSAPDHAPEDIPALTGVRAFAAVWVMLLHLQFSVGVQEHVRLGRLVGHGAWGVDIFFVLSGFILALLYVPRFQSAGLAATYRNYLAARFARIYPLHLLTLALLMLLVFGRALLRHDWSLPTGSNLYHLLLNLSLVHAWGYADGLNWNYPSWSISCEWFAYVLLLPALALGLRRLPALGSLVVAAALWTALYAAVHLGMHQRIAEQAVSWSIPRIVAEFTLGYALLRVYRRYAYGPRVADAMALAGTGAIIALAFLPDRTEWFLAPAVSLLILGLARSGPIGRAFFGHRWAVFWGERSYSIYMWHAVVQIFVGHLVLRLGLHEPSAATSWALLALLSALVLLVSHLAYGHVEVPMREKLRSLLSRRRPPQPAGAALASVGRALP